MYLSLIYLNFLSAADQLSVMKLDLTVFLFYLLFIYLFFN